MPKHSNIGWLNSNSTRDYPLKQGVTRGNGTNVIPQDFLVDAVFSGTDSSLRYRVGYIEILGVGSTLAVGFQDSAGNFLGVATLALPLTTSYQAQFFQPSDSTQITVRGKVVFGPGVAEVGNWAVGRYHFGFSSSELEPAVLIPQEGNTGVTSLGVLGDDENLFKGDVKLQAGDGIVLTPVIPVNAIKIDMAKQFKLDCPDSLDKFDRCSSCIKYINGIPPNEIGLFEIVGSQWINVANDPGNNRIVVSFNGEVNCCCIACEELQALVNRVTQVEGNLNFLTGFVNDLP